MGLLPRPGRVQGGHDRADRGADRAVCPGFRERVLARHAMGPAALEAHNPNNVGGDISGGAHTGLQLIARPFPSMDPYFTGTKGIYLCSSSTPPGAGVHGMCGYWAARSALKRDLR